MHIYLVGDIGTTCARIQLVQGDNKKTETVLIDKLYYPQNYNNLISLIKHFFNQNFDETTPYPEIACFSVPGVIQNGKTNVSRLTWNIDAHFLKKELNIASVKLINDFEAYGHGIAFLKDDDYITLTPSNVLPEENGLKTIVGVGFGFGQANIITSSNEYIVLPGEGGHSDFAARTKNEFDILSHIKAQLSLSRITVERIISKKGIENIFWYFVRTKKNISNEKIVEEVENSEDASQTIINYALNDNPDSICKMTIKAFVNAYGSEIGNIACRFLPFGGIYIIGDKKQRTEEIIKLGNLIDNFLDKGNSRKFLSQIPVYLIMNSETALFGCRYVSHQILNKKMCKNIDTKNFIRDFRPKSPKNLALSKKKKDKNTLKKIKNAFQSELNSDKSLNLKNLSLAGLGFGISALVYFGVSFVGQKMNQNRK